MVSKNTLVCIFIIILAIAYFKQDKLKKLMPPEVK
jgi:hypothetical protein